MKKKDLIQALNDYDDSTKLFITDFEGRSIVPLGKVIKFTLNYDEGLLLTSGDIKK
jgi:hypothetical protein